MTIEISHTENYSSIINNYRSKIVSPDDAVKCIKSKDKIIIHSNCAFPATLVEALVKRKDELVGVEIFHPLTVGELPYLRTGMEGHFKHYASFIGSNSRVAVQDGNADFIPIFLSEIPLLYKNGDQKLDAAIINVSPPDEHGFCSYGVEVGLTKTGAESAKIRIAQINKNMPRTLGDSFIHLSKLNYLIEVDEEIKQLPETDLDLNPEIKGVFSKIGEYIADLIEDGSTLQLGIGAIPSAVLQNLYNKKALGVHTEMFTDGIIGLVEKGIITNEMKTLHPGKIIAGFVLGTKKLYNFIDNNPQIEFHRQEYVNDPYIIAKNNKMVAVNSAIEVDITGQVCSDSIGTKLFSGLGGQVDFIRGAARSDGGKPIIALPSTTKNNTISKIVPFLKQGAGVVTSRADVHYVVTEFGVAQLFGKTIRQRAKELINIAHPEFREDLMKYAHDNKFI